MAMANVETPHRVQAVCCIVNQPNTNYTQTLTMLTATRSEAQIQRSKLHYTREKHQHSHAPSHAHLGRYVSEELQTLVEAVL